MFNNCLNSFVHAAISDVCVSLPLSTPLFPSSRLYKSFMASTGISCWCAVKKLPISYVPPAYLSPSPPFPSFNFIIRTRVLHRRDSWSFPERGRNTATAASPFKDLAPGTVFLLSLELQTFQWLFLETDWKLICLIPRNCFSAFVAPFPSCIATCELALYKSH